MIPATSEEESPLSGDEEREVQEKRNSSLSRWANHHVHPLYVPLVGLHKESQLSS